MTAPTDTAHWAHQFAAPTPAWFPQAACRGTNPDLFHPGRGQDVRNAKNVCVACPVRIECLDHAITLGVKVGIWGGTSARERRRRGARNIA